MPRTYRTSLTNDEFWYRVVEEVAGWRIKMESMASEGSRILCERDWAQRLAEMDRLKKVLLEFPSTPKEAFEVACLERDSCEKMHIRAKRVITEAPIEQGLSSKGETGEGPRGKDEIEHRISGKETETFR